MSESDPFTDGELALLKEYCAGCIDQLSVIDILGHASGAAQLRLDARIPRKMLSEDVRIHREQQREDQRAGAENSHDKDSASAGTKDEAAIAASLKAMSGAAARIFITGDGGTGKTEAARYLTYCLAEKFCSDPSSPSPLIPVYSRLKSFTSANDLVGSALDSTMLYNLRALQKKLAETGRLVLVLDGLDELKIDASTFETAAFAQLNASLRRCIVVIAGRESAMGSSLGPLFKPQNRYKLEPLTQPQIERYINAYFAQFGRKKFAADLIASVRVASPSIRLLLAQPFMLAVTCMQFKGGQLPQDPATLMRNAINELLARRNEIKNPELAYAQLAELAAFSCEKDFEFRDDDLPTSVTLDDLNTLDPHSGVLSSVQIEGVRTRAFSNKVVAEFLAGDWMAVGRSTDDELLDFYSKYVWSNEHRELLRWLAAGLWKYRPAMAARLCEWLLKHIEPLGPDGAGWPSDDFQATLLFRLLDILSAVRSEPRCGELALPLLRRADRFFGTCSFAYPDLLIATVASIPGEYHMHIEMLIKSLDRLIRSAQVDNEDMIRGLGYAVAVGWPEPGKKEARAALIDSLNALAQLAEDGFVINAFAQLRASGWPGANEDMIRSRLLAELSACTKPTKQSWEIGGLAYALAGTWPGNADVAAAVLGVFFGRYLLKWKQWAVVTGPFATLKKWAAACRWQTEAGGIVVEAIPQPATRRVVNPDFSGEPTKAADEEPKEGFLLARRECLRPDGLDPRLRPDADIFQGSEFGVAADRERAQPARIPRPAAIAVPLAAEPPPTTAPAVAAIAIMANPEPPAAVSPIATPGADTAQPLLAGSEEAPQLYVFRRVRGGWKFRFESAEITLADHLIGFEYLARLIEAGGKSLSPFQLMNAADHPDARPSGDVRRDREERYQKLKVLDEKIRDLQALPSTKRVEKELDKCLCLKKEIKNETSNRKLKSAAQGAAASIERALKRLREINSALAAHLSGCEIRDGNFGFKYRSENPQKWDVSWLLPPEQRGT